MNCRPVFPGGLIPYDLGLRPLSQEQQADRYEAIVNALRSGLPAYPPIVISTNGRRSLPVL